MSERLIIIDGNSIINRAFYGIRTLNTKDGTPTNAIYGFLNIMLKYTQDINPDYLCVAFDLSAPTFRHKMYSEYKAQRKRMPEELALQMPIMKQVLDAMNIKILEKEGYEADDIIGTVSDICDKSDIECIIVTGDKDDLQLATNTTKIYLTTTSKGATNTDIYDEAAVLEKYGVTPKQFIDVKALMGDTSDNIPGVAGIGEKTALSLIQTCKSIERLYDDINNSGAKGAVLTKLENGRESAFLSKTLATIDKNVPIDFIVEDARTKKYDNDALYQLLSKLEFKSLIKKLGLSENGVSSKSISKIELEKPQTIIISDTTELGELVKAVYNEKSLVYRIYKSNAMLDAIAIYTSKKVYYVPTGLFLTEHVIIDALSDIFNDKGIEKITHGAKDDIVLLHKFGVNYQNLAFDTAIGAYILEPSSTDYEISSLAEEYLNISILSEEYILGKGKSRVRICDIDENIAADFAAKQLLSIVHLKDYIANTLEKNDQHFLYYHIELPLVSVLANMQIVGVAVDKDNLYNFNKMLTARIDELKTKIYELAGCEFNINSTKQLGEVLFEKLGLKAVKKTKTGYSTDAAVLEKLVGSHDIIEYLIEYRLVNKIKTTYGDGLLSVINDETGRIHSSFNQTVTATGRISSTEPNMQNIPVRHELGREIRRMFVAKEGCTLVDADYSQIELRILAHIAKDEAMIKAFDDGVDIHAVTASQVLGIPLESVTSAQRSNAKAVNFGIVYGIGEFSLSKDLKISVYEARKYIDGYLGHYKGVKKYMDEIKNEAYEKGYVTTIFGRRRYIPELKSSNFNIRAFGERVALNTPIQGSAADIIKLAMVRVHERLLKEGLKSQLILQVHDELIVEAYDNELEKVKEILRSEMENVMKLDVSLLAEAKDAKSWYDAK